MCQLDKEEEDEIGAVEEISCMVAEVELRVGKVRAVVVKIHPFLFFQWQQQG